MVTVLARLRLTPLLDRYFESHSLSLTLGEVFHFVDSSIVLHLGFGRSKKLRQNAESESESEHKWQRNTVLNDLHKSQPVPLVQSVPQQRGTEAMTLSQLTVLSSQLF